ncbi:hypothetical protein Taro_029696 [Colocasia esculenta]|uniref:cyanoalanine nitrilase n=1 Tax=Colocasia esculenta TaxID=4460 RepID=A0A843VVN2_COLES|nr:hypothetical protein [Colocasia esculenta]
MAEADKQAEATVQFTGLRKDENLLDPSLWDSPLHHSSSPSFPLVLSSVLPPPSIPLLSLYTKFPGYSIYIRICSTDLSLLVMALVTSTAIDGALISEVDMGGGSDSTNTTTVRATVVQASTIFYDTPATMDKAERLIADAAGYGSQLVVFPEAFIGGYPRGLNFGVTIGSRSAKGTEQFQKYHTSAIDVPGRRNHINFHF